MKYISRGVNLDEEVWKVLQKLREEHGSYNKALRALLVDVKPKRPMRQKGDKTR